MINLLTHNRKVFILITVLTSIIALLLIVLAFRPQSLTTNNPILKAPEPSLTPAPKPDILPAPFIQNSQSSTVSWTFNYTLPALPQWTEVYQVVGYSLNTDQASQIIKTFANGTGQTQFLRGDSAIWTSNDQTESLSISLSSGYINHSNSKLPKKLDSNSPYSPQQLPQTAINFLTSHNLMHDDLIFNGQVKYLIGDDEPVETSDPDQANIYSVQLDRQINKQVLAMTNGQPSGTNIWINRLGEVVKMSYYYPQINVINEPYPAISPSEVQSLLRNNQGLIVNNDPDQGIVADGSNFNSVTLTSAKFGYLDDRQTGFIQPVLIFRGTGRLTNSQIQQLVVYLPLVKQ